MLSLLELDALPASLRARKSGLFLAFGADAAVPPSMAMSTHMNTEEVRTEWAPLVASYRIMYVLPDLAMGITAPKLTGAAVVV